MRFAGYAAVFGHVDRGGDVVRGGAFARAVARGAQAVPLLWQHQAGRPIGRIEYLKEDKRGLRVIGRLSDGSAGREAAALLKEGAVKGLSFGYRVRDARGEAPRELIDLQHRSSEDGARPAGGGDGALAAVAAARAGRAEAPCLSGWWSALGARRSGGLRRRCARWTRSFGTSCRRGSAARPGSSAW